MVNSNQKEIYFSENDAFLKLHEILKKNGVTEGFIESAFRGSESSSGIVSRLTRDFVKNKISEKDFYASLQKQLNIGIEASQNIVKEIVNKIVPLAENVGTDQKPSESVQATKKTNELSIPKPIVYESEKNKSLVGKATKEETHAEPIEIKKKIDTSSGSDKYRELIQ